MNGNKPHAGSASRSISRREFVKAAGATGITVGLAGCTVGGTEVNSNTVQWITSTDSVGVATDIRKALRSAGLPKEINLEIIAGPSDTDERQEQYTRWLSADLEEPALFDMDSGWTLNFINRNQLLNLSRALPESVVSRVNDTYFSASVETARGKDGDLYAIPMYPDFGMMLYRKDLVEKAGYNPDKEDWATKSMRWKKFSKVVADAKQQSNTQYGFGFQGNIYEGFSCCSFNEFMTSWGGAYFGGRKNLFGPIGERPVTVNEQPVIDSIKMLRSFIFGSNAPNTLDGYERISPTAVLSWEEDPSLSPFVAENMVAVRNWPYAIAAAGAEEALGKNLGVMPIPYGTTDRQSKYQNTGGPAAALGGWHIGVNPNTTQKEQALQVVEAMTRPSFLLKMFEVIGHIPPNRKLLGSRQARKTPVVGNFTEQFEVAGQNAIPRPVSVVWPQQSTKIAQHVHAGMSGAMSPKQAMNTLQQQLADIEIYNG